MTTSEFRFLGKPRPLLDGSEKVSGRARYVGDVELPRMLHARPVLSPYASAGIVSIDTEAARAVPGVVAVLTESDLPSRGRPMTARPSTILARERVFFAGQPVAVVVAESEAAAHDAAQLVAVEYDPWEPVMDPIAAMDPSSPLVWPNGLEGEDDMASLHAAVDTGEEDDEKAPSNVHGSVHHTRGDVDAGLAQAEVVIRRTYRTAIVHQAYMEPNASLADYDPVRRDLTVYASTQGQFQIRDEIAKAVGLPVQRVKIVQMVVGGGFGAKYGIIDPLVAATSMVVGRPVRMVLSRSEDFLSSTPAPGCVVDLELGVSRNGLTALRAKVVIDNGAFPMNIGGIISTLLGGYYRCENVDVECTEVVTTKMPAGAYRAPGAQTATFALESALDEALRQLGLDPMEFRLANVAGPGDAMGSGQPWPSLGLKECLERLRDHPAWQRHADRGENEGVGIAIGCWPGAASPAAAVCRADTDGSIQLLVGSADISGVHGSLVLVAAEVLQVDPDRIELVQGDTSYGPYAAPAGGSQTTYSVSRAVRAAAEEVRRQLLEAAAERLEVSDQDLELRDGRIEVKGAPTRGITIAEVAKHAQSQRGGPGPIVGDGRAAVEVNAPGATAHLVRVRVDRDTGLVEPIEYVAIQDVGFALNPMLVEGQIHGGVGQGIGWGLHEAISHSADGQLLTSTFLDYGIPSIDNVPDIDAVLVENPSPHGLNGARIVGEPPIVPGAAALANAITDAVGARVTELPVTPEAVRHALVG
jgi:CO/xanthine dehydrogenase Mo-binding subunit